MHDTGYIALWFIDFAGTFVLSKTNNTTTTLTTTTMKQETDSVF